MLFLKKGKGRYTIRFHRGPHFLEARASTQSSTAADSSLYEPLLAIGLDEATIHRILRRYNPRLVAECADMTLAAKERLGDKFFTKSPQAYFMDNLQEQAAGRRTPPDWWRELRKEEERPRWQADRDGRAANAAQGFETAFDAYLKLPNPWVLPQLAAKKTQRAIEEIRKRPEYGNLPCSTGENETTNCGG